MSAWWLFGRPYFLYRNSVGRQKMCTILDRWLMVMTCGANLGESWGRIQTDVRNVFVVTCWIPRAISRVKAMYADTKMWHQSNCVHTWAKDSGTDSILRFISKHHFGLPTHRLTWLWHFQDPFSMILCFVICLIKNVTFEREKTLFRQQMAAHFFEKKMEEMARPRP